MPQQIRPWVALMTDNEKYDFAQEFYFAMRAAVTGRVSRDTRKRIQKTKNASSKPFGSGRDPKTAADGLDEVLNSFGWQNQIAQAELFAKWAEVVGDLNAANSTPENLNQGTLTVRCKSTAWATQLKLMQAEILAQVQSKFALLDIENLRFVGPQAPSWKKGQRSVPGRGPRDTYG
jgi:predicted nucleic acid-binding Zn ribbon protein